MRHRTLALAGIISLAILPLVLQEFDQGFYIGFAARLLIYAIAASSLNLILGNGGMLSFGHAAFIGAGAYTVGILAAEGFSNAWIAWPLAIGVAAVTALVIGAISLRTRGVYFIMITLAFAQMIYYILVSLKAYGGDDGLNLSSRSSLGLGLDLKNEITWYYVCLVLMIAVLYFLHRMIEARFGRALEAIRENETRMEAVGFATYRHKLAAFVIAGAIAGLAGALLANQSSFVSPKLMHWTQSGSLMVMVIIGGVGHRYAGLIGAVVLLGLEEVIAEFTLYSQLGVGIVLLAIVLFAPQGIAGLFHRSPTKANAAKSAVKNAANVPTHRAANLTSESTATVPINSPADPTMKNAAILEVRGLCKQFGGIQANANIDLAVCGHEIHALIGPNGAGKTTFVAQLAGMLKADSGTIHFAGRDITRLSAHERVRAGLARSFQVTSIFGRRSVLENLALAVQARSGTSLSFWRSAFTETAIFDEARKLAGEVGLAGRVNELAQALAHGEQRQLEVGLALATRPRLLLLDEPMAGLGPDESERMIALMLGLKRQHAILLVEHDMDAVFRLADCISVLVAGRVIATGSPAQIREDAEVRKAYLGEAEA